MAARSVRRVTVMVTLMLFCTEAHGLNNEPLINCNMAALLSFLDCIGSMLVSDRAFQSTGRFQPWSSLEAVGFESSLYAELKLAVYGKPLSSS